MLGRLSKIKAKVVQKSKSKIDQAVDAAKSLSLDLKELLDTPIEPFPESQDEPAPETRVSSFDPPQLGNKSRPAQVYGEHSCPWTGRARSLLETAGVDFDFVDLDLPDNNALKSWLIAETKQHTNPYVFLRGRFIGGYNALDEIARLAQLEAYTRAPAASGDQRAGVRIEIMARNDQGRRAPGES